MAAGIAAQVLVLVWLGLVGAAGAQAAEAQGLYEAEVPVQGQGTAEREEALRRALAQVLVKLSGDRAAPKKPALAGLLKEASRYVQQYRYRTIAAEPSSSGELRLWARFDGEAVEGALRGEGVPVWGRTRPALLVWLAVEDANGRRLVGADSAADAAAALREAAQRRGLPLLLPRLDAEDQGRLRPDDLWSADPGVVLNASARYQAEAVLAGRMREERLGVWAARWTLHHAGSAGEWTSGGALAEVVEAGVDGAADRLASRLAASADGVGRTSATLVVSDIHSVESYARTVEYLTGLSVVARVEVIRVQGASVTFRLDLHGDPRTLEQAIALGSVLTAAPVMPLAGPASGGESVLSYRLLP